MSRLATRIARLEQALPPCPACRTRRTEIALVTPGRPAPMSPDRFCPSCGEPLERLTVVVGFDPDWSSAPAAEAAAEAGV